MLGSRNVKSIPVFCYYKFHGQKSLVMLVHGIKESDKNRATEQGGAELCIGHEKFRIPAPGLRHSDKP